MMIQEKNSNAVIISISSDIGTEMAKRWLSYGWRIVGTYRTITPSVAELSDIGASLIECDLSDEESMQSACKKIREQDFQWNVLVFCPGTQDPIGSFTGLNFDQWARSVNINFVNQLRILHNILPGRKLNGECEPCVIFFAGGGTNNATMNYSAYTISKIALIKMCELLDAEIKDTKFTIVGPGWVKTKIHESTMEAGEKAGDNLRRTKDKFANDEFTSIDEVLNCCEWLIKSPRELISGRNFSVVFDMWGKDILNNKLREDPDMYKLRRHGNNLFNRRKC